MAGLTDEDLTTPDVWAAQPCDHTDEGYLAYVIHLDEMVCACGARKRLYGADQRWHRTAQGFDARCAKA